MKWSRQQIDTLEQMIARGCGSAEIAKAVGRSRNATCNKINSLGLTAPRPWRAFTDAELEKLRTLAALGHGVTALARATNKTVEQIKKAVVRYSIPVQHRCVTKGWIRLEISEANLRIVGRAAANFGETSEVFLSLLVDDICRDDLFLAIHDRPPPRQPQRRNAYSVPARVVAAVPTPTPPPPTPDVAGIAMDAPPPSLPPPPVSIASLGPRLEGQIRYFASP